jgi:hypothetical protein
MNHGGSETLVNDRQMVCVRLEKLNERRNWKGSNEVDIGLDRASKIVITDIASYKPNAFIVGRAYSKFAKEIQRYLDGFGVNWPIFWHRI